MDNMDQVSDAQPRIRQRPSIQEHYSNKKNKLFDEYNVLDEKRFNILSTKNTPIRMTSLNVAIPKTSGPSQNPSIVENQKL